MKPLVIYHKNCPDGFAAAWVTGYAVGTEFVDQSVEFVQADYGDPIPDLTDREVYIVDFSWPPEKLLPATRTAKSVVLLDHHRTAYLDWQPVYHHLPGNVKVVIDLLESGASLAWRHFLSEPGSQYVRELPFILKVLKDYDLYTLQYPYTRDIVTGLRDTVRRQDWDEFKHYVLEDEGSDLIQELTAMGRAINAHIRAEVEAMIARNSRIQLFYGWKVPVANIPYEHRDLAGELMSKGHPFSVTYDDWHAKKVRKFSLRSTKGEGMDVEAIARRFGGGGHRHAAAITRRLDGPAPAYDPI